MDIPLNGVAVEVQADFDERGFYGLDDVPGGYVEVRYIVTIESTAPEQLINQIIEIADSRSPWLNNISRPFDVKRQVYHVQVPQSESDLVVS